MTDKWTPGNKPDIPIGSALKYWVTVMLPSGSLEVIPLTYKNQHLAPLPDDIDHTAAPACAEPVDVDSDLYLWSGWFTGVCQCCGTFFEYEEGATIIAYAQAPAAFDAL